MKRHKRKNYLNRTLQYLREHKGVLIEVDGLIRELKIPREKFTSAFITVVRRQLNKEGMILRAYPGHPHPTTSLLVAWKDGLENQEALQYEFDRNRRATNQAQARTDQHFDICQNLGYDPLRQLEGGKDASNSPDSK